MQEVEDGDFAAGRGEVSEAEDGGEDAGDVVR